jgi:hypothetical protein
VEHEPDDQPTTADAQTSSDAAELAVRRYLLWLRDPSALVDVAAVDELERTAAAATDPIERLKALSRLEQARAVDGERCKLDFIRYAKQWADEQRITVSAFHAVGVDDTILRAAGIGLSSSTARTRAPRSAPRADAGDGRSRSVGVEAIGAAVAEWTEEFTLADVVAKVGGSPMTVRKAIDDLVNRGTVRRLGPARDHHGRGRAPIVYRTA